MSYQVTNCVSYCPPGSTTIVSSVGQALDVGPLTGTTGAIAMRRGPAEILRTRTTKL